MIGFGQKTFVPDDNFENYLEANGMGDGIPSNDSVFTANINNVYNLNIAPYIDNFGNTINGGISDLTGIEDFTALVGLGVSYQSLTSLDLSANTNLALLNCRHNNLTSLDVSGGTALYYLLCNDNQLTSLDLGNGNALTHFHCQNNNLTTLDLSAHYDLKNFNCQNNKLTSLIFNDSAESIICSNNYLTCLDISSSPKLSINCSSNLLEQFNTKNGLFNDLYIDATSNNLTCVEVDNIGHATNNWVFDSFTTLTTNCNYANPCATVSAIQEHTSNKELLKVTDLLGRETKGTKNELLFYIYDDGTVEKRIVIE